MYHQCIMKLTSTLVAVAVLAPALASTFAQTATQAAAQPAAHKPAAHHTAAAAKPAVKTTAKLATDACGADAAPVLPVAIPKTEGCTKPLFALRYLDTLVGTGALAEARKWYTVAYTGYLLDGTKFDSSVGKDPISFPAGFHQVITGWDTGFEGMHVGGKRRLYIPYQLAYGDAGRPPVIPAKAELIFDIELLSVSDSQPAPKTPPAAAPAPVKPADATKPAETTKPTPPPAASAAPAKPAAPATDPTKPAATTPKP